MASSSAEAGPSKEAPATPRLDFKAPISGVFAIDKPSGPTCMSMLDRLKPLFASSPLFAGTQSARGSNQQRGKQARWLQKKLQNKNAQVKIGQGGTLDPMASGVMIIGLNDGTKALGKYQSQCEKSYDAVGLLGCETDSYDAVGKRVRLKEWRHVEEGAVRSACEKMRGKGTQIPPIYSALKMDGQPLYYYARKSLPLPRPIEARPCDIRSLSLTSWKAGGEHSHRWPKQKLEGEDKRAAERLEEMVMQATKKAKASPAKGPTKITVDEDGLREAAAAASSAVGQKRKLDATSSSNGAEPHSPKKVKVSEKGAALTVAPRTEEELEANDGGAPVFGVSMDVSSGTYVRTIIHDIGKAVGSAATVVELVRTRQGDFGRNDCIEWGVLEAACTAREKGEQAERDEQGLCLWERTLLKSLRRA